MHGRAILAERTPILLNRSSEREKAERELRKVFAGVIADHQEGVVIKAEEGGYGDWRCPWVKVMFFVTDGYDLC